MKGLTLNYNGILVLLGLSVTMVFFWLSKNDGGQATYENPKIRAAFENVAEITQIKKEWFMKSCLKEDFEKMSLEFLPDYIKKFEKSELMNCKNVGKIFNSMFELDSSYSELKLSDKFSKRVLGWLNNNEEYLKQAYKQKIVKLYNKFTNEEMIFNPLRGKRPIKKPEISDEKYTYDMINESAKKCDFCTNFKDNTAFDTFGRVETNLSYTAANTFKYDKWHSLILSRNHNPMNLTNDELLDMFNVATAWYQKANKIDKKAEYPEMIWDAMPKSGASQVHTHFQVSLGAKSYYGGMRRYLDASRRYFDLNKRNYFDDFILLHKALGLTYSLDDATLIANLIPVKEQEFIIIGTNSEKGLKSLVTLLHQTIGISVKKLGLFSWSMATFFPEINKKGDQNENKGKLNRIVCKVLFRSPAAAARSDINGLDIYYGSVLGIDRYTIASRLFKELDQIKKNFLFF